MVVKKVRVYSESGITKVLCQEKLYESEFLWWQNKNGMADLLTDYCLLLCVSSPGQRRSQ